MTEPASAGDGTPPEWLTAAERVFVLEHIGEDFVRQLRGHPPPVPVAAEHGPDHAGNEQQEPAYIFHGVSLMQSLVLNKPRKRDTPR
jgi:hypothetical protein